MNLKEFLNATPATLGPEAIEKLKGIDFEPSQIIFHKLPQEAIDLLKTCEEFKDVKQINILHTATFYTKENGDPILDEIPEVKFSLEQVAPDEKGNSSLKLQSEILGDRPAERIQSYKLFPNVQFNEVIDLYSIDFSPKVYDMETLGKGVWKGPVGLFYKTFEPQTEIRVVYSPEELQDDYTKTKDKRTTKLYQILEDIKTKMLSGNEPNVPFNRFIILRASARSIKSVPVL